ncbi:MAG: hypothetical protein LBU34_09580 [Planctomycetaceae bacterium]|nr:hypothetical protein [Planctomycetaceae bacterium]
MNQLFRNMCSPNNKTEWGSPIQIMDIPQELPNDQEIWEVPNLMPPE